jgi:hypothetical protein
MDETTVKRLLCCGFRRSGKEIGRLYQSWWRIWREIVVFFGSNITYFEFYIHLWPFYWLSLVNWSCSFQKPRYLLISVTGVCSELKMVELLLFKRDSVVLEKTSESFYVTLIYECPYHDENLVFRTPPARWWLWALCTHNSFWGMYKLSEYKIWGPVTHILSYIYGLTVLHVAMGTSDTAAA